jgi:hypothetical protein
LVPRSAQRRTCLPCCWIRESEGRVRVQGTGSGIQRFRVGSGVGFGFRVSASGIGGWGLEELGYLREGLLSMPFAVRRFEKGQRKKSKKQKDSKTEKKTKDSPIPSNIDQIDYFQLNTISISSQSFFFKNL